MRDFSRGRPVDHSDTEWIWRCHIDLTDANPDIWDFFQPFVEQHDAAVFTMPEFVPASLDMDDIVHRAAVHRPARRSKNLELPDPFVREICRQYGVDVDRPIVCQVSRFDPWKDPVGVIEAFRIVRESVPDAQLVLAGSMATDDPEGFHMWELTEEARAGDHSIHLLSNIQQVGAVQINAFQRAADIVVQKSLAGGLRPHRERRTLEGPAGRRRPCRRDHPPDRRRERPATSSIRSRTARSGASSCSRTRCAPTRWDCNGKEHVRRNFLSTRELEDWLRLFTDVGT